MSCLLNFSSQSNFIQVFKKYKHMTPKQYQDLHLKDQ
ncbi:AraC family transcriptional regulator [Candidatus Stoquefichus massiliensis]|nr:AraC family transcriptional regulator [Candidatus Stoquefichus massiliensis]